MDINVKKDKKAEIVYFNYVISHEGIYIPEDQSNVRIVTINCPDAAGLYVSLYIDTVDNYMETIDSASWTPNDKFYKTNSTINISFSEGY